MQRPLWEDKRPSPCSSNPISMARQRTRVKPRRLVDRACGALCLPSTRGCDQSAAWRGELGPLVTITPTRHRTNGRSNMFGPRVLPRQHTLQELASSEIDDRRRNMCEKFRAAISELKQHFSHHFPTVARRHLAVFGILCAGLLDSLDRWTTARSTLRVHGPSRVPRENVPSPAWSLLRERRVPTRSYRV